MKRALSHITALMLIASAAFASPQTGPLDMQDYQINRLATGVAGSDAARVDQIPTPLPTATPITGTGLIAQTAANTFATRTITGSTNKITVSNGDGVSGNPILSFNDWLLWTPTLSCSGVGCSFSSTSTTFSRYIRLGNLVCFRIFFSGTTGSNPDHLNATLPATSAESGQACAFGISDGGSTIAAIGVLSTSTVQVARYDAALWSNGASRQVFGNCCYEAN